MIFVSYAKKDTPVARTVLEKLRANNLDVYDWQLETGRGHRFIESIENNIREASSFVALVSPNFLASTWCRRERELAVLRDDEADRRSGRQFLHVLKVGEVPHADTGFLSAYDWFDMQRLDSLTDALIKAGSSHTERPALSAAGHQLSLFRNREEELSRVGGSLRNPAGPHFWLVVAPPQLGKTWFMDRISVQLTEDAQWASNLVDLRHYAPERLTDSGQILADLFGERPRGTSLADLADFARKIIGTRKSHLCMLDSAELLDRRTTATLRRCLSEIHRLVQEGGNIDVRLALVVGSRREDGWTGVNPSPRLESLRLTQFAENVVEDAVRGLARQMNRNFEPQTYRSNALRVHRLSEGLPALLVQCLQWIYDNEWVGMERLEQWQLFSDLASRYIRERLLSAGSLFPGTNPTRDGPRRALDEAFRVLAPYRLFTQSHLRHHLELDDPFRSAVEAEGWAEEDLWRAIDGTALLLQPHNELWQSLHGAIRRLLYRYYFPSDEHRLRAHRRAREFMTEWSSTLTGSDQVAGLIECLWHDAAALRIEQPGRFGEELHRSAELLSGSLAGKQFPVAALRRNMAERIAKDEELAGLVGEEFDRIIQAVLGPIGES